MGTCSSKDQIEKSVVSPPRSPTRPRSNNVNVPTTSSSPLPDARHEYPTVTGHLRTKPKDTKDDEDVHDHPFFPHEAETPEVLSALSSTNDEKSDTDGKVHTSAAFESSEEYATSKELQMSAHPGSLPDDYQDALDKFGKSLTDSHILKSETKPLHQFESAEIDARPLASRSFTERKSISEKSIIVSKHKPLHSAAAPSKEAKDPAKAFTTREESHRSTATFAAPEEVGNLSTRDTAEAREAVVSIQGQAKVSKISPAIKTVTEFAISSFDQQPVSIPDLTEKGERPETVPATSPATDIAANRPTTDSKETTESTVETEKFDEESHTDLYTDATKEEDGANGTAFKGVRLIELECDNENRDFHRKNNTDEQRDLSNIKVCGEPAMAQNPNAAQEIVENFPSKNDAMLAEQTIPLEESQKKIITGPATDETMEPNVLNTYQVKQDARTGEPESSHVENVVMTKIRSIDIVSPDMEDRQCGEPAMAQNPNAAQEVVEIFPAKNDVMLAEQTIPLEESQKKIITAPASDETVEPNVQNTYQVKQDARIGESESSHVEHVVMTKIRRIDQQETVLSPAMEDQQTKSQSNPANITTTKVVGILPTKENEQIAYLAEQINKQQKETSRALASDVTTEGTVLQIDAATEDKGMGYENSNKRNVEKTESRVDDEQQLTLSPALEEQHKKMQSAPFINEVKDGEMLHTRNNAWEADPTITSGELHKVLDPIATDATKEVDVTALNTAAQGQCMDIQSIKVGKAEETASIYDEKKQDPLEDKGKDPYAAPPASAVTSTANIPMMDRTNATLQAGEHHKLSCTTTTIKKDIQSDNVAAEAVLDVEIESKDIKADQNNKNIDVDEQLNVSSPSLKEKYEESDIAQPTILALAVIKTFNAKDDTVELKQIRLQEELHKEFNRTSVIDATAEATNEERGDAKVEELESSGVQELKEPESRSIDQQETVLYPVYQTEESHISPVIVPATKVDGMLPTVSSMQTTELTITTDEKNKESSSSPDANVETEEDPLLINIAREAKDSEHGRNNEENAERTQSTSAEQQSNLSPALEEQHEESQTCSDINAAKEVPESVHNKENAGEADPMIPSEELHDHSHMVVTKIKMEEDAIAINGAEKGEATKLESNDVENARGPACLFVNKEQLQSLPAIEEQGQEIDQALGIDGVTEIVERLATITGTDISGIQDQKEPESRSTDEHETISYPSLVDQREKSHRSPDIVSVTKVDQMFPTNNEVQTTDLTITTDENHKQSRRAPDDNVRTEEDAVVINAAIEAEGLEHGSNIEKNAEREERTNAEQRPTLSPVLEEEHEDPQTCKDINEAKETSETVHREENAWEANPVISSKELHDQSHAAATETKIEEDTTAINGVQEGESTKLESNKVENAQETAGLCINKEQLHSPPSIEEQGQETDPTPDNDGVTEVFENVAITNGKHIKSIQDLTQPDSRSIDLQETISYPSLVNQTEVSQRSPVIPAKEVDGMFPTNNEAQTTDLPITTDEKHKESSRAPDANVRIEEDALLIDAAREPEGLEHERNNDENTVMTETTNAEQLSTLSPDFEEQHEDSQTCSEINAANEIPETVRRKENTWEEDPVISSEELHDQSHTAATITKLEEDYIAINGVEKGEAMELESKNVENAEEPASLCVNKEQSHSPPAIEVQAQETDPALDTDGIQDNVESLDNIIATHISGIQYLKEPESRSIVQQEPISYPSLVDQTEESHRSPVIIPVTKADEMSSTNNEAQAKDLTITADENHKETRRAPDDNVRTEEDDLLINAAREAKGLEHGRNIDKSAERAEGIIAEQQSTLSPALEEHDDLQTCSDINAANETSENVHGKENAWEADPMIPSKELHDQSDTAATETNVEEDAIAINGVENGEAIELESNKVEIAQEPASICVNKEESHSPPAMGEQGQEIDPILDTKGVSEVVTSLATINATHIMGVQDLKEPESRSIDQQQMISYPYLVYQTEESHSSPVIVPATEVEGVFPTDNEAKTTDLPITTDEKHKESSRGPDANVRAEEDALLSNAAREADVFHIDRVAEDRDIKHEKDNGKNAEKTKATGVDEQPSTSYPALEEQHEEPKASPYIHVGIEIPKTIHTHDNVSEEDLTIAPGALHKYSDITTSERKIEVDVTAINEVAERELGEVKSNKVEKAEEPASKYVDRQKSCSPAAMEKTVESDLARATHVLNEIAENLSMMDETTTAVQTESHHKETNITPLIRSDAHTAHMMLEMAEQDKEYGSAPAIDAITEDKSVEHESDNGEHAEKTQTTGADKQPSSLCPTLEEKHEESKVSSYINAVIEVPKTINTLDNESASDLTVVFEELHKHSYTVNSERKIEMDVHSINGVNEGNMVEVKSNKVEKAELASEYVDKPQLHSPAAMEEQVEDSDSAPTTRAVKAIAENLPMLDETTAVQTEKHHEESNTTTLTDLEGDDAHTAHLMVGKEEQDKESSRPPDTDAITEDKGVEYESDDERNTEKTETTGGVDEQPSTLSPALEEQHEELQSSLYINAATEVLKTHYTWDNASEANLILATNELHKHSDTTSDREIEADLTASDEVAERKVLEEKSNDKERAEEPESKYVEKQQSHSPTAIREQVEDSDLTHTISAVKEIAENLPMMDETMTAVKKEYHRKDSHITLFMDSTKDEDILANSIAVKVVEVAESKEKVAEKGKKLENADADEQQSVSSPILKKKIEETDATQTTDTAPEAAETFADERKSFSSSVLQECEETDTTEATDTAPEAVETFADEQQITSSSALKENCEEADIAEATVTAQEAVRNFDTNDNKMAAKETMEVKEPHKDINMTLITDAAIGAGVGNQENRENVDADQQQSVSSPVLEENSEERDTTQATDTASEALETFGDEQQKISPFALRECEETDATEATVTEPETAEASNSEQKTISSSVLKEQCEETDTTLATNTAQNAVETFVDEQKKISSLVLKECEETNTCEATDTAPKSVKAFDDEQKSTPVLKENCEKTDATQTTDTAPEAAEIFVDEQQKFSSSGLQECEETDTSEATDTAPEAVKAFDTEQKSTTSSVLKENCEETDATQTTDTAPEAAEIFVDEQQKISSSSLQECEETDTSEATDAAPEAVETFVDEQQSISSSVLKEIFEETDIAEATDTAQEAKEPHKEINMTLVSDGTTGAGVENQRNHENVDADQKQSVSSPVLEENSEETDTTQARDTALEAVETFGDEQQKVSSFALKVCEETDTTEATDTAKDAVETFVDEQKKNSSLVLKECEETNTFEATDTAPESVKAFDNEQKSTPVLKENCEKTDATQTTDTSPEATEIFVDEQQNFSSSGLQECEETDTSEATDTAPEAVKAFDDEQKSTPSSVLKENCEETDANQTTDTAPEAAEIFADEQQKFSSSGLQECEEVDTNEATDAAPEAIETFVDEQQSISSSVLKEISEETDVAEATDTAQEAKEPHKEINMTLVSDGTTDAGVENQRNHENVDVDQQQSASSPVLEENSEETDTTQARDTASEAVETFGDEQQKVSSFALKVCEETVTTESTDTAQDAVETFVDEQKKKSSLVLKECEETNTCEATDTAPESVKAFDNEQKSTVLKENCEKTGATQTTDTAPEATEIFVDEQQNFSSSGLQECEETDTSEATDTAPEAVKAFDDEQKSTPSSLLKENCEETDANQTTDTAPEAAEIFVDEQQKFSSSGLQEREEIDTSEATDPAPEAVETLVDEQQSISSSVLKEISEETDIAEATDTAQEAKEPHKEINMTLVSNGTTGAGFENQRNHENVDADQQQSVSSPVLEENSEETDTTQARDTASEAVETFGDEQQKVSSFALKVCEETDRTEATDTEPEVAETFNNQQKSISSSVLRENCKETDIAQATDTFPEFIENIYVNKNAMVAKERMVVKEPHKEFNVTPITNPTTDTVVENERKIENIDADKQQSVSSPVLKEKCEETDTTLATNTTQEAVETFVVEQRSFSSSVLKECEKTITSEATDTAPEAVEAFTDEQKSTPSSVLKEYFEETDATQSTDITPEVVENFVAEQKNLSSSVIQEREETDTTEDTNTAPEAVETSADEQQSISSSVSNENCEETDIAEATVTALEAVENFDTNDNEMVTKETMEVIEPYKEINMTLITIATTGAGVENRKNNENVYADQQPSVSSSVLEENSEETITTQATDTASEALETFGDEQHKFSSFALKECEETATSEATDTEPEAADTSNNEQKSISSSVLKKNYEETEIAQASDTAAEVIENFYRNENAMVEKETMLVKEPHKEFNMTAITNATTDTVVENERNHENTDAYKQQSVSSPDLKEKCEETDTTLATNTAQEVVETFDDEQQRFSCSVLKECAETNTSKATDTAPEAVEAFDDEQKSTPSSVLKETYEETNIPQDTDTAPDAVESFYTNENGMVAKETMAVKEPHKELKMTLITNATTDANVPVMDEIKENAKVQELESSSEEIIKEPESRWLDHQKSFLSSAMEEHEESHTNLVNSGSTEIVRILPTKNDAQTADLMMSTDENHEKSNKAPDTDLKIEADSLFINAVTEEKYVGHEKSNVENAKEMITTGPHEPHSTLSPPLKEQHAESEASPAIKEVTEICETIDTWGIAQTQELMIYSEQHHEKPDTTSPRETTGIDVINMKAIADDEVDELVTSKVEKADELARIYVEKQQSHSPPTMREQDEESNQILATNAAIEILKNHHTKDVAQTTDPTASSEEQFKGSDKTPVGDSTLEDVQHIKVLSKGAQSMGHVSKNIDSAEHPDTDASKQQTASFPTSKEECEESDIVQPSKVRTQTIDTFDSKNDAETADPTVPREGKEKEPNNAPTAEETRDNDIAMGTITEDIKVGGLQGSDVENLEKIDSTGEGHQHIVLSTYTFPAKSSASEIVEALPTGNNAKKTELMVQAKEWQKESESTLMTDAPTDTGSFVVDAVLHDVVVEQESNNIQNVEEGRSKNVYKQQAYLSPVREEHHEESQIMSDTNALTEIGQIHYRRDKEQITDPIAISGVYEKSHTTPTSDPKSAVDDIAVSSNTTGDAVQLKGSNLENAEEPENEIADELQRVPSQALEKKSGQPNTAKPTIATMEIDETTGTRNNAQIEDMRAPTENFDIAQKNIEAEVLAMDRITEEVTAGMIRSTTVETPEENSTDVYQQSVSYQNLEEHLAASAAVSEHCEIKEIADALLTSENTWTMYETVPIEQKHEKIDKSSNQ